MQALLTTAMSLYEDESGLDLWARHAKGTERLFLRPSCTRVRAESYHSQNGKDHIDEVTKSKSMKKRRQWIARRVDVDFQVSEPPR